MEESSQSSDGLRWVPNSSQQRRYHSNRVSILFSTFPPFSQTITRFSLDVQSKCHLVKEEEEELLSGVYGRLRTVSKVVSPLSFLVRAVLLLFLEKRDKF